MCSNVVPNHGAHSRCSPTYIHGTGTKNVRYSRDPRTRWSASLPKQPGARRTCLAQGTRQGPPAELCGRQTLPPPPVTRFNTANGESLHEDESVWRVARSPRVEEERPRVLRCSGRRALPLSGFYHLGFAGRGHSARPAPVRAVPRA